MSQFSKNLPKETRENALLILHIFAALTSQKSGKHARFLGLRAVHASHHARMRIAIENMWISSKYDSHF